jgi:hypothetical protein
LVKDKNDKLDEFKMVCISGDHSGVYEMEKNDNVIVSSVQSLCNKTMYLSNILGDKVIIVVDEAHHTIALSYKRIIKAVTEKIPSAKLLGLTATPVRFTNKDTEELMQYFDNNIVYSVSMSKLIADGTLSIPEYKRVDTDIDIETMIDIDERKYIEQRKELSPSLLEKVAKTNERNYIIVDEYIKNKDKYGKTIIFALNVIHCLALDDAFKQRGIRSSYVYTMNGDNNEVIERFRHNEREDGIDVLININILTEGSDIPNIQTVFLTRPTSSDTLLMQMVGRGMRGVACGGTDSVNIVDFCDKWSSISCWMNPMFLLADETIAPDDKPVEYVYKPMELMPVDMIRDIIKGISYNGIGNVRCDMALPVGWYDVIDSDGCDTKVLVFENQLAGYIAWRKAKVEYLENTLLTGEDVLNEFFCGFGFLPDKNELQYVLDYLRSEGTFPTLQRFKERDEVEPYIIAKELKKANAIDAIDEKINSTYEEHKDIIDSLYGDKAYYGQRVWDYIRYKNGIVPIGTRVEEVEKEFYTLSSEPQPKSIDELLDEVIDEQGDKFVEDFVRPEIAWTDKDYKSYFGVYYTQNNCIRINRLLNSVSVPEEVVKFVIYHECLHQEMPNHFKAFRAKERLYPNFAEYENFLFCKFPDFDRECAM